jgi:NAD(P)H-hydrate epimerase
MMNQPNFLYNRDPESHKGDYGHALLVAGSYGKMGAAVLAARACLRSGVGLLTVHVPRCGVDILQTAVPEAMLSIDADDHLFTSLPANLDRYDAIAIGPGLGTDERTQAALVALLESRQEWLRKGKQLSLVIDADGLNNLAKHPEALHLAEGAVITPHVREYQRLFGDAEPQQMADLHHLVIVKKAHRTGIFAPALTPMTNDTGNPGMATAGSGDVLSGILAATAAAAEPLDAASAAAWINGKAGELAQSRAGSVSMTAGDTANCVRDIVKGLEFNS